MRLEATLTTARPVQIGLIVLQADETVERDMRRLLPPEVELLVSRVPSGAELTAESIDAMGAALTQAAALLPRGARFAAMGYACTSASARLGPERVAGLIRAGVEVPHVTDPASALVADCRARGITRLGLLDPYTPDVSAPLRAMLARAGIATPAHAGFEEAEEARVVRIDEGSILRGVEAVAGMAEVEAVFVSCTNLRTLDLLEEAERRIGRPVLSSNLVLARHLLALAAVPGPA